LYTKVNEGRLNIADLVRSERIDLIFPTQVGRTSFYERVIRRAAIQYSVPCVTTLNGGLATVTAIISPPFQPFA
jgi:carbamoyl-phosphate synthase large subunit